LEKLMVMSSKSRADKDWYRNSNWNPEIETKFFEKLRRARDKAQYLKIQAACLTATHPREAFKLIEKFFELGESLFVPDAYLAEANAHLTLGQNSEAVDSFKKALERERLVPSYKTTAWSEFALLVADRRLEPHFDEAVRVLAEHGSNLMFASELFAWHGAYALIQAARGDQVVAKEHAVKALEAAKMGHSGLRYHPTAGLVGGEHKEIRKKLRRLTRGHFLSALPPWL
jgi:tetratricopeptide (TPR) repeat protein